MSPCHVRLVTALLAASFAVACGHDETPARRGPRVPLVSTMAKRKAAPAPPADPLGPRPAVAPAPRFAPPVPVVYARPNGMNVWLLERHALPLVAVELVVPAGASHDPAGKGGLALATANMLDEGAGSRGALEIARDVDALGASLSTGAYADYAFVHLVSLTKNFAKAAEIMRDVVMKPKFAPAEWARVHALWTNDLKARKDDPQAVSSVVTQKLAFPDGHVYAHPTNGTIASAARIKLDDVKKFYAEAWKPGEATLVVVGDITRADLDPLLDRLFAGASSSPPKASAPAAGAPEPAPTPGRRVVLVNRAEAPQAVIAFVRRGVAAADPEAPPLVRVNAALGGSFTSRLNQTLREEKGWSYGAHSRFSFSAMKGLFVAQAAVHTEHTGEAVKALLDEIETLAANGLTDEEVEKTRMLARSDLVDIYGSNDGIARRLARYAALKLPPDQEAKSSVLLDAAGKQELKRLAAAYLRPSEGAIVIVGPREAIAPQLANVGITSVESAGPEGEKGEGGRREPEEKKK